MAEDNLKNSDRNSNYPLKFKWISSSRESIVYALQNIIRVSERIKYRDSEEKEKNFLFFKKETSFDKKEMGTGMEMEMPYENCISREKYGNTCSA